MYNNEGNSRVTPSTMDPSVTTDLSRCGCDTECSTEASATCVIHGANKKHPNAAEEIEELTPSKSPKNKPPKYTESDPLIEQEPDTTEVHNNTIGAINELHGHMKYDINNHVEIEELNDESDVMRTALNGVLHMGVSQAEKDRMRALAEQADMESKEESSHAKKKKITTTKLNRKAKGKRVDEEDPRCLCRQKTSTYTPIPSNKIRAKPATKPKRYINMPMQPPPLGYKWSYRRTSQPGPNEENNTLDYRGCISPPFRWVLVPRSLKLKPKPAYDYLRDAKYGYRNQMDPGDFRVTNFFNFPPFCYPITEKLRFPYKNYNSPPFPKRQPLHFMKTGFKDKITDEESPETVQKYKDTYSKLSVKQICKKEDRVKKIIRRKTMDLEHDPWAGYRPKYLATPIKQLWKYNWQPVYVPPQEIVKAVPECCAKKSKSAAKTKSSNQIIKPVVHTRPMAKGESYW